jgi:hypothetical protein
MAKRINTPSGTVIVDGVYSDEQNARTAAARWSLWVVMGDVGQYLTVKPRDAARLERAGYEIL